MSKWEPAFLQTLNGCCMDACRMGWMPLDEISKITPPALTTSQGGMA